MEKFQEGIILLGTGIVVVMAILSLLAISVGIMVRLEEKWKAREKAKQEAAKASEPGRMPAEFVAVIGLALHQYFAELEAKKEVFEIELGLPQFLLELEGLLFVEGLFGFLDEGQHVAHAEDAGGEPVRVERLQGVRFLPDADELDRHATHEQPLVETRVIENGENPIGPPGFGWRLADPLEVVPVEEAHQDLQEQPNKEVEESLHFAAQFLTGRQVAARRSGSALR